MVATQCWWQTGDFFGHSAGFSACLVGARVCYTARQPPIQATVYSVGARAVPAKRA